MKRLLLFTFIGLNLFACSSDNEENNTNNPDVVFPVPLQSGNYWTYDVIGNGTNSRDSLYISGDTIIQAKSYKKFKTKDNLSNGFYSTALKNNGVREENQLLLLNGDFSLGQGQTLPIGLDLTLSDFIIFKKNASEGELLSTKSGSFQQTNNNIPMTIEYNLKSKGGVTLNSFNSPNGDSYSEVKTTKIVLNLKVSTVQVINGVPFTITLFPSQDVVTSTQYIAKNIGVVYTKTVTTYTLDSNLAGQLGIPATTNQTQEEFLDTYSVN